MDGIDLAGLRFSSSKPPNPTWFAWGSERGGALAIDGVEYLGATAPDRIAKGPPRVLGIDAPFGVPVGLAKMLSPLVTNGSQVLEQLVVTPSAKLDAAWATFATEHPGALRLTDAITHGAPSITAPRPPSWRTLRGLAQVLWGLRDRVLIVPFDALEISPARSNVIEVLPASTLRLLGLPYLRRHGGEAASAADLTEERLHCIAKLTESLGAYGVRAEFPAHVANACAQDAGGDALDAVLSLVTVYLATRGHWTPPPISGFGAAKALIEGWIVRPGG